jgi:lipid-binding SYLF domain-containing protein
MTRKFSAMICLAAAIGWAQEETPDKRLRNSADVLQQVLSPEKGISHDLFNRAKCVIVVPGMKKGAFVVGADYGRGYATCRSGDTWSGPAAVRVGGGSFGAQLGVESTDLVILVMNQRGMDRLAGNKFTIGADASAALGPIGRTAAAQTDATLKAEMLTYSRAKGAFAGVALDGTTITPDHPEDKKLYGRDESNRDIINGKVTAPPAASSLIQVLNQYSKAKG